MKKLTLISLAVILVISLIGCNKQQEPIDEGCWTDAIQYDYDEFMAIYGNEASNTNSVQTVSVSNLVIPKLKTDDFYCINVLVSDGRYEYIYNPIDRSKEKVFLGSLGIRVTIHDGDSAFYQARDNDDFLTEYISDEYAYNKYSNMWDIYKHGKSITIYFPDNIKFTDPERISDYFEFEVLNPSTDNTVTE